jgi:Type II secretion system (T2SS), protein E, N-terminal domain
MQAHFLSTMAVPLGVGNVLAEAGDLTVRRLSRASTWQKTYGGTIERALLSTGAVTEEVLTAALSQAYGLPGVSRATLANSDPDIVDCLPAKERRRLRAFPFGLSGKHLMVATCDPRNLVLLRNLAAATGFDVDLHVTPDPVLEDLIESFEGRAAGIAPAPGVQPVSPAVPAGFSAPDDSIGRLGRALLAEALRFGATELELGANTHGAFLRTFDAEHPAVTRRLSAAFLGPLAAWFQDCCRRAEDFVIEANGPQGPVRRRIELLAADTHGVRVRLHPFEETANGGLPKAVDLSCRHENAAGFVFCPHCGDVL